MTNGMKALIVEDEANEVNSVLASKTALRLKSQTLKSQLKLKRSFNMFNTKYWRIIGPVEHPFYHSDLSVEGMQDWRII